MADHYRVIAKDTRGRARPEVKIGLIPGRMGPCELPRLVGARKRAEMCALGEPLSATEALTAGVVDQIIEGDSARRSDRVRPTTNHRETNPRSARLRLPIWTISARSSAQTH